MPEFYAKGTNIKQGTAFLENVKSLVCYFQEPYFLKKPRIQITFAADAPPAQNPSIVAVELDRFTLRFNIPVTTTVEWQAVERE